MRRTTSHVDHRDLTTVAAGGSLVRALDFDRTYAELSAARAEYDSHAGDPDRVPSLAAAAKRLSEARAAMAAVRTV